MTARLQAIGNRLGPLSYSQKLSDAEVAERAGISRAQLNRIRNGRTIPRIDTAIALARVFGCRVGELFYLIGPRPDGRRKMSHASRPAPGHSGPG